MHARYAAKYTLLYALIVAEHLNIAGSDVRRIDARYTSQTCSTYGKLTPKSLSVRTHVCQHCSFVMDRDQHAALNIVQAAAQPFSQREPRRFRMSGPNELSSHFLEGVALSRRDVLFELFNQETLLGNDRFHNIAD